MTAARLKDVADIRVSNVDKKIIEGETLVRLCNYTDVYYNPRMTGDLPFMVGTASTEQVQRFGLRRGDVVITKDSETADDIAVPARIETDATDLVCGYHLALIRPNSADLDARYLYWTMASSTTREFYTTAATGVTRFGLRQDSIGDLRVRLPAEAEQRAIADFLDAETGRIDHLLKWNGHLLRLLIDRGQAVVDKEIEQIRLTSVSVKAKHILQAVDERAGAAYRELQMLSVSIHTGVVPRSDLTSDLPRADDLSRYKVCRQGDLVLNRMRAFQGGVGVATTPGIVSPDYLIMRPTVDIDSGFLNFLARSTWFVSEMTARLRGIGGVDQGNVRTPRVGADELGQIAVPVPDRKLQSDLSSKIAREIAAKDRLGNLIGHQVTLLHEHRQALITAAVTGEIDVSTASGRGVPA